MPQGSLNERDAKLVEWLNEAHAKEAELEADLTAHIALTQKDSYKKRLRQHLAETRDHKKRVAARIKKLGGSPVTGSSLPGPVAEVAGRVPGPMGEVAGKAVVAVKGQVGIARAAMTSQPETHLRNAQDELREEHVEIAIYTRIETFANEVGDRDTAQLAKSVRRDEERMAKFLGAELGRLVKDVVRAEVPRDQRAGATRTRARRSTGSTRSTSRTRSSSRTPSPRTRARAASRTGGGSSSRSSGGSSSRSSGGSSRGGRSSRGGGSSSRS